METFLVENVLGMGQAREVETKQAGEAKRHPKYRPIDRKQMSWVALDVENLISPDHPARMIWGIVGRMDLSAWEKKVASFEKEAGRAAWPPRLLLSVLVYGYTLGTSSAREMERWMEHEPGLRWLTGLDAINHHTLSDFRTQEVESLKGMLTQVLALLASEDLVDFQTLLQDGTKIKAQAGKPSMHRRGTVSEQLEKARAFVAELERRAAEAPAESPLAAKRSKKEAAQERAARERLARMEAAMRELEKREAAAEPAKKDEVRVSISEPEARKMKHPDGSFALSYNLQLVTEVKNGFPVGLLVTNTHNDLHELEPGLAMAESCTQVEPQQVVTDKGYSRRENIEAMAERGITLVAPRLSEDERNAGALSKAGIDLAFAPSKFKLAADKQTMKCPAGAVLVQIKGGRHHGLPVQGYEAEAAVCGACAHKPQCCPKREARQIERVIESAAVEAHDQRMNDPVFQDLYKKRKQLAEYPNLRIKSDWRLNRFRLRGLEKVNKEAFWMVLAFAMDRWHFQRQQIARAAKLAA